MVRIAALHVWSPSGEKLLVVIHYAGSVVSLGFVRGGCQEFAHVGLLRRRGGRLERVAITSKTDSALVAGIGSEDDLSVDAKSFELTDEEPLLAVRTNNAIGTGPGWSELSLFRLHESKLTLILGTETSYRDATASSPTETLTRIETRRGRGAYYELTVEKTQRSCQMGSNGMVCGGAEAAISSDVLRFDGRGYRSAKQDVSDTRRVVDPEL